MPLEQIVFFLDRSLGSKIIATLLREAGAAVQVHDDHFPQDTKDEIWLRSAGESGWVVLTKDERIRYRELERRALMAAGVRAFVLTARNLSAAEMGQAFIGALPPMQKLLARHKGPFIANVTRGGRVKVIVE